MKQIFYFILMPIIFTVVGEFLLKISVDGQVIRFDLPSLMLILSSPAIMMGVALICVSALLWIVGMSLFQLSFMYPFLSLNYVIIIVGSEFILKENVQLNRYLSILLIIIGLVIISRSQNVKIKES
jgi:drug/metabolite transporter (DMT)-like permease